MLYVALTRAKEKLIITGTCDNLETKMAKTLTFAQRSSAIQYLDWIIPALAYIPEEIPVTFEEVLLEEIVRDEVETEVSGKIQEEILRRWDTSAEYDANVRQTLEEQFAYQYPYPKSHDRKMKFTVSELKKMAYQAELDNEENALGEVVFEEPEVVPLLPKFMTEEETLTGAPRGTAYHRVMELLDFEKMYACGFNRISMGMQTAVEDELRLLGRIHSIDDAKTSVERAKSAGFNNISLDLMMGIPNQTIESLEKSISFCAECKVTHISSYILKIEENTPFYKVQNKLKLANDDMQAEMYLKAVEMLDSLGYKQYEISNFAKQGYESRHNTNYWRCGEYIGIGPSAHSFFDGKRFFYSRSMDDFNNNKLSFEGTGGDEEEFIMLSLRLKSGLNYSEFEEKFGYTLPSYIIKKAKEYEKYGYTNVTDKSISFTPKGFLVSNSIISELI